MKFDPQSKSRPGHLGIGAVPHPRKGFALIAALSIMSLLVLIGIALFSLSAVTLRISQQTSARLKAEANARTALMIALGELQKNLGPDRAITATSEILTTSPAKSHLTGVWESWWDFDPSNSPDYAGEKNNRFKRWLVSAPNVADLESLNFVNDSWNETTVELIGQGSLGGNASDEGRVYAGLVPVSGNGNQSGSFAWHVSDESVKARVNLYRAPPDESSGQSATLAEKRALLAGHRPDISVIEDADGNTLDFLPNDKDYNSYLNAIQTVGKVTNLEQAELLEGAHGKIRPLRHDITPYSLGVMSDVRGGGLKKDLSSIFEMSDASSITLPPQLNNRELYETTHGITGVSDPKWSALTSYYNSFRRLTDPETNPTYELESGVASLDEVPDQFYPAPVIVKVDTIFSMVGRPMTDVGWLSGYQEADFFVNLIVTPVVVLHNPYNVNVSFHKMEVRFENIPIALNIMMNKGSGSGFESQSVVPGNFEGLNTMYGNHNDRGDKNFVIHIANWSNNEPLRKSDAIDGDIIIKPGQSIVCAPVFPADASFYNDARGGRDVDAYDWHRRDDLGTGVLTENVKGKPAFTPGIGFEITAMQISNSLPGQGRHSWNSYLMLRDVNAPDRPSTASVTDLFYLEYKLQKPFWYDQHLNGTQPPYTTREISSPTFSVTAKLQATASDALVDYAQLQYDYEDTSTLQDVFGDKVYRYPPDSALTGTEVAAPGRTTYATQYTYVHPFAIFSAYTRTTNGGVYETGLRTEQSLNSPRVNLLKDGRLAGKPFLFHNPSRTNFILDLANQKPGVQPYELNFQPFLSKGDYEDYMDVGADNRVPSLSGNKSTTGIKSGSYLEIPSGPLQTIADFRRSNAFTTAYLPHFVQPVGNSLLHPLMSPDRVIESDSSISDDELLDHSVLANHALYDRFYFSTFATRGDEAPDTVFEDFMTGAAPLASQAFQPYLPRNQTVESAKAELFSASGKPRNDAFLTAAEFQMINGPFNVNSTSVSAWKAVLASLNDTDLPTFWPRNAELETLNASGVPIAPMSLLNGGAVGSAAIDSNEIDNSRTNDWNGYRALSTTGSEDELERLALAIVEEVRERGPFLSLSEFVNRQIGSNSASTRMGALESALAKAEINEVADANMATSFLNQVPITPDDISDTDLYAYKTAEASTGNPAAGAPGWVTQGDLLRILGPAATVRGDTFVIRVYGDAQGSNGEVAARVYGEAVVQRLPEYVNPRDRPSVNVITDPSAADANRHFGRRFEIVSFRWLSGNEI